MDAPTLTPSMRVALEDLKLEQLTVVYPGKRSYALGSQTRVLPLEAVISVGIDSLLPRRRTRAR